MPIVVDTGMGTTDAGNRDVAMILFPSLPPKKCNEPTIPVIRHDPIDDM